jgi:hypothetical protein
MTSIKHRREIKVHRVMNNGESRKRCNRPPRIHNYTPMVMKHHIKSVQSIYNYM